MADLRYSGTLSFKDEATPALKKVRSEFKGVESEMAKTLQTAKNFAIGFIGIEAIKQTIGGLVKSASDANETMNKMREVFGEASASVEKFSQNAAESTGASTQAFQEMAGTLGNLLVPMGFTKQAAADVSVQMVQLAADLGSFNNITTAEALDKIRAGLIGESEPLRSLGVQLSEVRIQNEALALGLVKSKNEIDSHTKAQAALSLIMKDTKAAQGDFARTSDGLANSTKILTAEFENLKQGLGEDLLPVAVEVVKTLRDVLGWVKENKDEISKFAKGATELGIALGGGAMIARIYAFGSGVAASVATASAAMTGGAAVAAGLRAAIFMIPASWTIAVALIGAKLVYDQIVELQAALGQAKQAAQNWASSSDRAAYIQQGAYQDLIRENKALAKEETATAKKRIAENQKVIEYKIAQEAWSLSEVHRANIEKQKIEAGTFEFSRKKELEAASVTAKAEAEKALSKVKEIQKGLTAEEKEINKSYGEKARIAFDGETKIEKAKSDAIDAAAKAPSAKGGAGGKGKNAADEAAKKMKEEAEKIKKEQEDVFESLQKTQNGFSDLRLGATNAMIDLERTHKEKVNEITKKTDELKKSLLELAQAYEQQIAGFDRSAGERVVEQEQHIKDLQAQLDDARTSGDTSKISTLADQLAKEQAALADFVAQNKGLEDEIIEARRRAGETDFQRYVEDLAAKRVEAQKDFDEKKKKLDEDIKLQEDQKTKEVAIYEAKRAAFESVSDRIRTYWSGIMDDMTNRTQGFADMAAASLESARKAFESIKQYQAEGTAAADLRAAKDYLPAANKSAAVDILRSLPARAHGGLVQPGSAYMVGERGAEVFMPTQSGRIVPSSGSSTKVEVNFGGITIAREVDAQKVLRMIEDGITRKLQLQRLASIA